MKRSVFDPKVKQELLQRLDKLQEGTSPVWGEMTARQMLKHLQMAFQIGTGELAISDRSSFFTRNVLRYFLLRDMVPSKRQLDKNPPMTFPEIDLQMNTAIKVADFATEKGNFSSALEQLAAVENYVDQHPLIGKMKREDWGFHMYSHINYHFTQFGL